MGREEYKVSITADRPWTLGEKKLNVLCKPRTYSKVGLVRKAICDAWLILIFYSYIGKNNNQSSPKPGPSIRHSSILNLKGTLLLRSAHHSLNMSVYLCVCVYVSEHVVDPLRCIHDWCFLLSCSVYRVSPKTLWPSQSEWRWFWNLSLFYLYHLLAPYWVQPDWAPLVTSCQCFPPCCFCHKQVTRRGSNETAVMARPLTPTKTQLCAHGGTNTSTPTPPNTVAYTGTHGYESTHPHANTDLHILTMTKCNLSLWTMQMYPLIQGYTKYTFSCLCISIWLEQNLLLINGK